jgi:hypothetical protein
MPSYGSCWIGVKEENIIAAQQEAHRPGGIVESCPNPWLREDQQSLVVEYKETILGKATGF